MRNFRITEFLLHILEIPVMPRHLSSKHDPDSASLCLGKSFKVYSLASLGLIFGPYPDCLIQVQGECMQHAAMSVSSIIWH